MTSRISASHITAFDKTFLHWSRYGHVPSFVRIDAKTLTELGKSLVDEKKVTFQYFPTGTHLANREERCIRTRKNHFISTIAKASSKFPMSYWNKLILLAEITLNCLLPWQPNPAITAYHGITGALFKFCTHPVPPYSSMRHLKHVVHGQGMVFLVIIFTHYRSHHVFVTAISAPRVTDTVA